MSNPGVVGLLAVFYRIATPEVFEVLRAAEELLGDVGRRIALCPNYRSLGVAGE
ncbi:MAG TPA: hypothetical protein VE569_13420 [Acidimicrobiia bacterium]|jgi:hypothetical protein|nr:hypothetical protein [Acidimicrobiia bacterium]